MNKTDLILLIVCLVSVLLCFVFYMNTAIIEEKARDHYTKQFEEHCTDYDADPYYGTEAFPILNFSNWRTT